MLTHSACTKSLLERELTQASHGIFKYASKVQSSNSSTRGNGDLQHLGDHPGALKSAAKKPRLGDQPGATSRERIGGDGDGTCPAWGGACRVQRGHAGHIGALIDPSHQKRNVWCFPGSCRAPWGSHNHVVSVRKLLALNSKCAFTATSVTKRYWIRLVTQANGQRGAGRPPSSGGGGVPLGGRGWQAEVRAAPTGTLGGSVRG